MSLRPTHATRPLQVSSPLPKFRKTDLVLTPCQTSHVTSQPRLFLHDPFVGQAQITAHDAPRRGSIQPKKFPVDAVKPDQRWNDETTTIFLGAPECKHAGWLATRSRLVR